MKDAPSRVYSRVLLKLSGESFCGDTSSFALKKIESVAQEIATISKQGIEIGIVVGGGNIIRGGTFQKYGIPRQSGDSMGMLATVINALLLQEFLLQSDRDVRVITSTPIEGIGETYDFRHCQQYLRQKKIVLFAGGTGHPYFTTDTAAALRAVEIDADCFFKGTKVDGVYDADPVTTPDAKKFENLTYKQVLSGEYRVMDFTAVSFCMENRLPIRVFNLTVPGNLSHAVNGKNIGTLIADK